MTGKLETGGVGAEVAHQIAFEQAECHSFPVASRKARSIKIMSVCR